MKLLYLLFPIFIFTNPYADQVYERVSNITNPTPADYELIQEYISHGIIPHIDRIHDWKGTCYPRDVVIYRKRNRIIHKLIPVNIPGEILDLSTQKISIKPKNLRNCIVLYSTYNGRFRWQLMRIIRVIRQSKFKGHILCRLGGWPNIAGGDIVLSHVPNGFRVAAIREAKRLGFKRALWLDVDMIPRKNPNRIFKRIKQKGVFAYLTPYSLRAMCKYGEHIGALNLSLEQARDMFTITTNALGFDFSDETANKFLEEWYEYVKYKERSCMTGHLDHCLLGYIANLFYERDHFPDQRRHVNTSNKKNLEFEHE